MPESLHVVLAFDDSFWAPAYTTMRSVCLTTRRRSDLVFHLVHTAITAEHRADLDAIKDDFDAVTLVYHDLENSPEATALITGLPSSRRHTNLHYGRLAIDKLIDPQVKRVAYLDSDLLVMWPIEELLAADLKGNPIGAVQSGDFLREAGGRDMRGRRHLYDPAEGYFNSGVLLIDMDKWRAEDVPAAVRAMSEKFNRAFGDQDLLNLVFRGRWTPLDPAWNAYARGWAAETIPVKVIHFAGPTKPWHIWERIALKRVYRHVMTNELFWRFVRYRLGLFLARAAKRLVGRA